jgi:hypothetical protein
MDEDLAHQILDELFEHLEDVETQSAAILHFLKAKGIATDEQLSPYFEEASKATSVKWVAERARINYLLAAATRLPDKAAEKKPTKPAATDPNPTPDTREETDTGKDEQDGKDGQRANKAARKANAEGNAATHTDTGKDQSTNDKSKEEKNSRRREQATNAN